MTEKIMYDREQRYLRWYGLIFGSLFIAMEKEGNVLDSLFGWILFFDYLLSCFLAGIILTFFDIGLFLFGMTFASFLIGCLFAGILFSVFLAVLFALVLAFYERVDSLKSEYNKTYKKYKGKKDV